MHQEQDMSNLRQAAQRALKAMEDGEYRADMIEFSDALVALRQALAEPESDYERGFVDGMQEQMKRSVDKAVNRMAQTTHWEGAPTPRKPLTTPAPRQWVSLTEQEMYDLFFHDQYGPRLPEYLVNTIKCIEAALKEKNSGS